DLAIVTSQFAQNRLNDLATLAPLSPFVEPPLVVHQWHVVVAWVCAQRAQPLRGPVVAAAFDQTAARRAMDLEQGYPIDASGYPEQGQKLRNDITPVTASDDPRRRIGYGVQHLCAARQFHHRLPTFGEIVESGNYGGLASVGYRAAGESQPELP